MTDTVKAICFDLDGVYFTSKGKNSFHQALISEYHIPKEIVDNFMYKSPEMAALVRGKISNENFWNRLRELTGITATDEELTHRWIRDYEVNDEVKEIVHKVKKLGYKTCICTNNNAIRLPLLIKQFHLNEDFDCIVSSHEVGQTKPHKEIYKALLRQLNIKPEELVYSDDNPERLSGATQLGIKTFVFENFEQFIYKLQGLGINLT